MTIFVIDDDAFALKTVRRQLEALGLADIVCFQDAAEALPQICEHAGPETLILCDLQMPGIDGVELVRHLTEFGYAGELALISGEDERILQTAALLARTHRLRLVGALHKPFSQNQMRELLEARSDAQGMGEAASDPKERSYSADELAHGIAADQLICHYQPKVALATGAVAGVEALVRWRHPRDGLVFPDRFIIVAEESGQIGDVTRNVLAQALRQARLWREVGLDLTVCINVSMDDLGSLDFPEAVSAVLRENDLGPETLILEITETKLMKDRRSALDVLARLRLKHVGLAVDDFGTGHSSFAQLRDVPFTELKIDRGFVNGAARDAARHSIFDACLQVAHQLHLKTVAEGAEDLEDWEFLRRAGCDMVQGYFVARPMPADALPGWIAEWGGRYESLAAAG